MNNELVNILKSAPTPSEPCDREIATEWYNYGLSIGDDFFLKFMMHWIAFNWIYSSYEDKLEEYPREIDTIKCCVCKNIDVFKKYDAFNSNEIQIFYKKPIIDERTAKAKKHIWNILKNKSKNEDERIFALFETLYKVRCNLFHGSKSIRNPRDIELVKASSVILGSYLKVFLDEYNDMRG